MFIDKGSMRKISERRKRLHMKKKGKKGLAVGKGLEFLGVKNMMLPISGIHTQLLLRKKN